MRANEELECGLLSHLKPTLADYLRPLHNLTSITISHQKFQPHGLPWCTLRDILSLPSLRHFTLHKLHFAARRLAGGDEYNVISLPPIKVFKHRMVHAYTVPEVFPTETAALSSVLSHIHRSLETLHLFGPSAPAQSLHELEWPHLRELVIFNGPWKTHTPHPITLLTRMPNLRSLVLKYTDAQRVPLWPPGHIGPFPWPKLERLVISSPVADDSIYDNLPKTLQSLSLRYWKHLWYYQYYLWEPGPWDTSQFAVHDPPYESMMHASTLLGILRRCRLPELQRLEVEYIEDEDEEDLLAHPTTSFPRLTYLKLQRYQLDVTLNSDIPTVRIVTCRSRSFRLTMT